jgi:glucose/arabinose dehydrogenase
MLAQRSRRGAALFAAMFLTGLVSSAHALQGQVVATGLTEPLFVTAPDGDKRLFIVEQAGAIKVAIKGRLSTFLDLTGIVNSEGTRGLLGMAFDPKYASNGRFYVNYVDSTTLNTVVARYTVSPPTADRADPSTRQQILSYVQEVFPSHRGGWIGFRPGDRRNLYISTGDGSGEYDPPSNAQNKSLMLGKLLRIDVSGPGTGYAIPADNPFVGVSGVLPEIWALGLRNPFRPSFDRLTGDFWIADVGQDTREEINFEPAGIRQPGRFGDRRLRLPRPIDSRSRRPLLLR